MNKYSKILQTCWPTKWNRMCVHLGSTTRSVEINRYSKFHTKPKSAVGLSYNSSIFCVKDAILFQQPTLQSVCFFNTKRTLSTMEEKKGLQKSVSALQVKKRVTKKKSSISSEDARKDKLCAVAYSSAEEYDLSTLLQEIEKKGLYKVLPLPEDAEEVLHVSAKYLLGKEPRHIYFFGEGCVVFWNVPDLEQKSVLEFLKPFEVNSYAEDLVMEESEDLEFLYDEGQAKFSKGQIFLSSAADNDLETYSFSDGLALSVKLSMWEAALDAFVDGIEGVTEDMKNGKRIVMSRNKVLQKRGELLSLRHVTNLSSDLLDTPDFYWNRQQLEIIYHQVYNHLSISKRTKVMNERLNYCSELIDLLTNYTSDKHHVRLEWMIIILIMVEVMFECIHFLHR